MSGRQGGPGRFSRGYLTEEEKNNRPKVTLELVKRIGSYLKPYWKEMLLVLIAIFAASFLNLMPAVLTGRIIDEGLIGKDMSALIRLILLSLAVFAGANLIGILESYLNIWIAQHVTFDMRNSMFKHLQSMSHGFFTSTNQGEVITRMTGDISGVQSIIANTMASILTNVITLAVSVAMMIDKSPVLAAVGIAIIPLFALPTKWVGKTRWSLTQETQERQDEINGILSESLSVSGQLLVKLYGREEEEYNRYENSNKKMIALAIRESMAGRWFRAALGTFSNVGPMLVYLAGGILIMNYNDSITIGDITVMVALLGKMYFPIHSLMNIQVDWIRSMALFTRIFDYFDIEQDIKNIEHPIIPDNTVGNLQFKNVSFSYEENRPVLQDISFHLNSGKSIAIVGPSGSGKSTIASLIARLYDADKGEILMDGINIRNLDLKYLRDQIGMVSQETYLFNGTIRENLLYAKSDATEEELIEACKKANIHGFIEKQPGGFDTIVGNRGLKLSGGEKQRLSIARVLLKDPAFIIFDEATSSLDSISEHLIQESIEPLIKSRSAIIIAHRLSTILSADHILVVQDGKIVEQGNHKDLITKDGFYTELYKTQFLKSLCAGEEQCA